MNIDLYIGKRTINFLAGFKGGERTAYDVSFDPIARAAWSRGDQRCEAEACSRPTLVIEVPDTWERTHEHGVTNLCFQGRYIDPRALLALARVRGSGTRVLSGIDPIRREVNAVEIITQPSFSFTGKEHS